MRISSAYIVAATFAIGALLSVITAALAVDVIEDSTEISLRGGLDENGLHWAEIQADGLRVTLSGTAPSEARRFKALSVAGGIVDAARVIDEMSVKPFKTVAPPRFSVEILRNETGISLIGLIPRATDRDALLTRLRDLDDGDGRVEVSDFLETADYPVPELWPGTIDFAIEATALLSRAKISANAGEVHVTAMADSRAARRKLQAELSRLAPPELRLAMDISAPRPAITPFTLRLLIRDGIARFDACSADTEAARERILAAARKAGMEGDGTCTIGLGVPTPRWAAAVETAIAALDDLGGGALTFADTDVSLVANEGTDQARFDTVVGALENDLPEVFSLHATLPEHEQQEARAAPEFTATLSPEGLVQLRGRLRTEQTRRAANSFAKARFGAAAVHMAARLDDTLPARWTIRVLTALDALARLSNGVVTVTQERLTVSGDTGQPDARADIARLLADKLGESARFEIDVTYIEQLDPVAQMPTPEECVADINAILAENKISFEPGSTTPDAAAAGVISDIADVLKECGEIRLEISGHTDSQGRAEMNQRLSKARAQAVLNALRARRILTGSFVARGYGEEQPIADNDTEEGREANRRIEFRLLRPEGAEQTGESDAAEDADAATPDSTGGTGGDDGDGGANTQKKAGKQDEQD
ncbi:OmpA family protein [Sediminimonas sp.]|uniref:OmpA family protein n=1 Tax=Sediminimonas sp. TaxID=2823379 RepID=UPI0025DC97E3|nr:OmpA family protein [Sediminimonas sp.]